MCQSGYMGGDTINPNYKEVCSGETNHAEVVEIHFDEDLVSYEDLLDIFWKNHNPTTLNRQGLDIGTQYRSVIYYTSDTQRDSPLKSIELIQEKWSNPIVTKIENLHENSYFF